MEELKIKFIYKGEKNFLNFLKYIKYDLKSNAFDKHVWSGDVKIGDEISKEKDKDFTSILLRIFFNLQHKNNNIPIEMNLWYKH